MAQATLKIDNARLRSAGWSAVVSGVLGIFVVVCLVAYLVYRNDNFSKGLLFQSFHDGGLALQYLLMLPAAFSFYNLSQQQNAAIDRVTLNMGITAIILTALFALLIFPKILSDGFYTLPQGLFGLWLIIVNWKLAGIFSRGFRWFGMVVGFGLVLVGMFFVLYALFVSTIMLRIPAAPLDDVANVPHTPANNFLHYFIDIGSLLGVLTLPFWSIIMGGKLMRKKAGIQHGFANIPADE